MANIDLFALVTKENLIVNQPLKYELHIYLKENDSIVFFKQKGAVITPEELAGLIKNPSTEVLLKKSDLALILQESGDSLVSALKSRKKLDSKEVLAAASIILRSLDLAKPSPGSKVSATAAKREGLLGVHKIVIAMISEVGSKPLVHCYDSVLKSIENTAMSDLDMHNLQVSALSVLMYLTEGKGNPDDVAHLALAGLMHDVGLNDVPSELLDRHLAQDERFNQFEQEEYYEHINNSLEQVKRLYPGVSSIVLKAIEYHHENFDGSGPKKMAGNFIPHLARIIRIADDVSISIVKSKFKLDFKDALGALMGANILKYDLGIIKVISEHYLAVGLGL